MGNKLRVEDYGNVSIIYSWFNKERVEDIQSLYDISKKLLKNILEKKGDIGENPLSLFFLGILINLFGESLKINHPENLLFSYTLNQEDKKELQQILGELPNTIEPNDKNWGKIKEEINMLYAECEKTGGIKSLLLRMTGSHAFYAKL